MNMLTAIFLTSWILFESNQFNEMYQDALDLLSFPYREDFYLKRLLRHWHSSECCDISPLMTWAYWETSARFSDNGFSSFPDLSQTKKERNRKTEMKNKHNQHDQK